MLNGYVEEFRKFKPEVIKGYANAIYMLAKYCNDNSIEDLQPRTLITSAEKLLDSRRSVIEDAFNAKVFDYYGSREIGAIAAECEEHNGYHISAENIVLESIRDGESTSFGEEGAVIVTNLRNYGMPFIRYQIGDVGKLSDEKCSCGRGLPMMSSIEGRLSDFLAIYDKKADKIVPYMVGAPGFVGAIFMYVPVNSYRVIQERLDKIRIQLVRGKGYSEKDNDFVITAVKRFLGDNCEVEFEYLDDIPPLPSGKRSTFSSEVDPWKNVSK
jgi:phenylacetate-CoA ligase